MAKIRSLLFLLCIAVLVFPYALLIAVFVVFPHPVRFDVARRFARLMVKLLKFFCNVDMQVEGEELLPDEPCVVLLKHSSPWETLAQFLVFPPHVIVLKRELMWVPIFGWGLASLRSIAINRKAGRSSLKQILDQGKQRLSEGIWVMIFPEGTRVKNGQLGRFGSGGANLACTANVPVIPVAHNAGDHWPNGQLEKIPGTITMRIGAPISTSGKTADQVTQEARQWMEEAMQEISVAHKAQTHTF